MADYYPLISRAVAARDKKSKEARREVYVVDQKSD
jgi:hypothetical protein